TLRSTRYRARLAAEMPSRASTNADGTATTSAGRTSTEGTKSAAATATGIASTASVPRTIARMRAGLLLLIRPAVGGGRHRASDDTGDRDEGEDVRERLEQGAGAEDRRRRVDVGGGHRERERRREPEQARGAERPERLPLAEDQRREGDEPAAARHLLVERMREPDREVRPSHRREDARGGDTGVARPVDVD